MCLPPPRPPLFPYTTLFRSDALEPLKRALNAEKITADALPTDLRATYVSRDGRYRVQAFPAGKGADAESLKRFLTARSEEHTSELQSRFDLVCRLLLEKKKE